MDAGSGKDRVMIDSMQIKSSGKKFLSPKELAEYMGLSVHTIYLWIQLRKIPHNKIGKLVRFNLAEIDAWLKAQHIEPSAE